MNLYQIKAEGFTQCTKVCIPQVSKQMTSNTIKIVKGKENIKISLKWQMITEITVTPKRDEQQSVTKIKE